MMNDPEKSDLPIVAGKPLNEAARVVEEGVERRGGTKENADQQTTARTQSRKAVSHAQTRIRNAVNRNPTEPLTALLHHVTIDVLRAGFFSLRRPLPPASTGYCGKITRKTSRRTSGIFTNASIRARIGLWPLVVGTY